jgi:hypothetical protein
MYTAVTIFLDSIAINLYSGKASDFEEFHLLVTWERGDNNLKKNDINEYKMYQAFSQ